MDSKEEAKKKVDENWKEQVKREKKEAKEKQVSYHEPTFTIFLSSLSMQAMIAMGKLQNPLTNRIEKNMEQAKYLIDTLGVLKDKTRGNLTKEEETMLDESLFNLRMLYVEEKKNV